MSERRGRVKLEDIARVCGCSVNTVSCALRNDARVSPQTKRRIQQTALQMGYVRNNLASSLRSGKTNMVAIIVNEMHNQHFTGAIRQIEHHLNAAGYDVMILCTQTDEERGMQMIRVAISMSVDGILYYPYPTDEPAINMIRQSNIPFVLLDRWVDGVTADTVRYDDMAGGYMAGKRLLALGHKRFVYMAGTLNNSSQLDRETGFMNAIAEAGLPAASVRIVTWNSMQQAVADDRLFELLSPIDYTALLSFNDEMAYLIMNTFQENNVRVPEDVSLLSFDYIRQYAAYLPPLSSISGVAGHDFPGATVDLLLERIKNPRGEPCSIIFPVTIYDDGTIGPAK